MIVFCIIHIADMKAGHKAVSDCDQLLHQPSCPLTGSRNLFHHLVLGRFLHVQNLYALMLFRNIEILQLYKFCAAR